MVEDRENELIAWRSVEGSDIDTEGRVKFRDAGPRGTIVESCRAMIAAMRRARRSWQCDKGGRVSIAGVYGRNLDKFPLGAMMQKGLEIRTGQTHVQRYIPDLLSRIERDEIDTTFLISHHLPLEQASEGYRNLHDKQDEWTKVVLRP